MSDQLSTNSPRLRRLLRRPTSAQVVTALALVVVLVGPLYLGGLWMRLGAIVAITAIGAIGLTILTGLTGQLSLAHAFFVGVGAFVYTWLGSDNAALPGGFNGGWPPVLAALAAVVAAGLAGLAFSPVAGRLRGIYLGVASFSLVFIGQDIMTSATPLTGGFNGRSVPEFSVLGFHIADDHPFLTVAGVVIGADERLWYMCFAALGAALLVGTRLVRSRAGRAFIAVRDNEPSAAAMGIAVQRYKAASFVASSMFAGLAGVLYALYIGSISADSFGFTLSIQYLVAIIIGGLGSLSGAVAGAAFVACLPVLLQQYAGSIPLINPPGSGGLTSTDASSYIYGLAILVSVLCAPQGLAGLWRRLASARSASEDPLARDSAQDAVAQVSDPALPTPTQTGDAFAATDGPTHIQPAAHPITRSKS